MLNENIKAMRKAKGLSQEELAVRLNVVRQTVSKWETGLSVPDADLLISLSEQLDTSVSALLGEPLSAPPAEDVKAIAEKLETINLQLAQRKNTVRKVWHGVFVGLSVLIVGIFAVLFALQSPYLGWNYQDPETAVFGAAFHAFEYLFVRAAPILLIGAIVAAVLTRKKP